MEAFLLCFIPIFVASDPAGIMPIYLSLTEGMPRRDKKRVLVQSVLSAFALSIVFLIGGLEIFRFLGISLADFQIAGGIILLVIAVIDLIQPDKDERRPDMHVGVVPIGIPLIMGPAALTSIIMLSNQFGVFLVTLALLSDLVIVLLALLMAAKLRDWVGISGMKAISKVVSLFLAAIAVMFIRVGVEAFLQ